MFLVKVRYNLNSQPLHTCDLYALFTIQLHMSCCIGKSLEIINLSITALNMLLHALLISHSNSYESKDIINQHNRADCFHRFAVTLTFIKLFKKFTTTSGYRNKMSLVVLKSSSLILEFHFCHLFLIKSR